MLTSDEPQEYLWLLFKSPSYNRGTLGELKGSYTNASEDLSPDPRRAESLPKEKGTSTHCT